MKGLRKDRMMAITLVISCLTHGVSPLQHTVEVRSKWIAHIDINIGDDTVGDGSADKPFRTLAGLESSRMSQLGGINFGPGIHDLVATDGLFLGSNYSGSQDNPFVIQGSGLGATLLSGGLKLSGFNESTMKTRSGVAIRVWTTHIPDLKYFRQLFTRETLSGNFTRRYTARSAVMSYNHTNMQNPKYSIVYNPGQVQSTYHSQDDVLATLFHCWTATTHKINSIDAANNTLTLLQAPHVDIPRCEHASGKRFYIENALEELDTPGEFYLDRSSQLLSYLPLDNEQIQTTELWAPQVLTLLNVNGASNVIVKDLSLVHGQTDMNGFFIHDCDGQSATNLRSAAVGFNCTEPCSGISMNNVEVAHVGTVGITVAGGASGITLHQLQVHDVGAGAIRIGSDALTSPSSDETIRTSSAVMGIEVSDSTLWDGGHIYLMGPGVSMEDCYGCNITHNNIHTFHYTGITTGYGFRSGLVINSSLSYNHIHGIGSSTQEFGLSDMGCVYNWGGDQQLKVDHTLCHNVSAYSYGGWGLYNDQTTENVIMTNNIIFSTRDEAYHNHEGVNVTMFNNILIGDAATGEGVLKSASPAPPPQNWHAAAKIHRNIVYGRVAPIFSGTPPADSEWTQSHLDDNVYWHNSESIVFPGGANFTQWQKIGAGGPLGGQDKNSIIANPQFIDLVSDNFNLKASSPALKLGFIPIDMTTVGPSSDRRGQPL